MTSNPDVEQMLILTNREGAEQCVRELSQDEYRNYQVIGVVLMDDIYDSDKKQPADSDSGEDVSDPAAREAAATEEIAGISGFG